MNIQEFMAANKPSNGRAGVLTPFIADIKTLVESGYTISDIQKYINEAKNIKASYQLIRYQVIKIEKEIEEAETKVEEAETKVDEDETEA